MSRQRNHNDKRYRVVADGLVSGTTDEETAARLEYIMEENGRDPEVIAVTDADDTVEAR
jgi:hypothetical protein